MSAPGSAGPAVIQSSRNAITTKQNEPWMLQLLRAKSALYDRAQLYYTLQFAAAGVLTVILSLLKVLVPATSAGVAVAGVAIFLADYLLLDPAQKRLRTLGAQMQELFDCEVLSLPFRPDRTGRLPGPETVAEWAGRQPSVAELRNWYAVEVATLPLSFARIACQRSGAYWNATMRRRYSSHLRGIIWSAVVVLVITALATEQSVLDTLTWAATLLPLMAWTAREERRQRESADASEALVERGQRLWSRAIADEEPPGELVQEAREFQNDLYEQRRRDQQVFGWVYRRYRDLDERNMRVGVSTLVADYHARHAELTPR